MSVDTNTCVRHGYTHLREMSEPHNIVSDFNYYVFSLISILKKFMFIIKL